MKRARTESDMSSQSLKNIGLAIVGEVMELKAGSRRNISILFTDLPDADDYPIYYQIIKKPVCLNSILVIFYCFFLV